VSDDLCAGDRGSYGPKRAMVLDEPDSKHGSEVADRLVMTTAEQCSDLDQETAPTRNSVRMLTPSLCVALCNQAAQPLRQLYLLGVKTAQHGRFLQFLIGG
jgi:hypothetical protein